ncbi:hypothetical protein F8388_011370 [Cannabis sativa]|uniref:Uncharacterized protein n=1 Tax=Cannabis sativa TaxID=3483 RepID=A0A7J6EVT1_CANSA|nr:hypothetical protein F8388_011370 [Cannabis sativa]
MVLDFLKIKFKSIFTEAPALLITLSTSFSQRRGCSNLEGNRLKPLSMVSLSFESEVAGGLIVSRVSE